MALGEDGAEWCRSRSRSRARTSSGPLRGPWRWRGSRNRLLSLDVTYVRTQPTLRGGARPLPYAFLFLALPLLAQDRTDPLLAGRGARRDPPRGRRRRRPRDRARARAASTACRARRASPRPPSTCARRPPPRASPTSRSSAFRRTGPRSTLTSAPMWAGTPSPPCSRRFRRGRSTIARFPELSVALADYSRDADVTAELVDVGPGTTAKDYEGRDVRGKLVLADGTLPVVHRLACEERGAAGFLSAYPNQHTPWSGDDRDLIRWGHLSPYQTREPLRDSWSRAARRRSCERGSRPARRSGCTRACPRRWSRRATTSSSATIPGTDPAAGEVVVTAHLCHESAGANDNASGSAAILEVARALAAAIRKRTLTVRGGRSASSGCRRSRARRPISCATRAGPPVRRRRPHGHGRRPALHDEGTFHLSRTAESLPHAINAIAEAWFDSVVARVSALRRSGRLRLLGRARLAARLARGVPRRRARARDRQRPRGLRGRRDSRVPMVYFHD